MFFRRFSIIIFVVIPSLFLNACTNYLRSHHDQEKVVNLSVSGPACLGAVPQALSNYFEDTATDEEVTQSFDCIKQSIQKFGKYTHGDVSADSYTAQEIQYFFNTYFLKDNQISDEFLVDILKVKSLVAGGDNKTIKRSELSAIVNFLDILKQSALVLKGNVRLALYKDDFKKVDEKNLNNLHDKLKSTIVNVLQACNTSGANYEVSDFKSLTNNISIFLNEPTSIKKFQAWIPFLDSLKELFLGSDSKLLSRSQWQQSATWTVDAYMSALTFYYKVRHLAFKAPSEWNEFFPWIENALNLIETSPVFQDMHELPAAKMDQVIEKFLDLHLINTRFTAQIAENTYRKFLMYLIEGKTIPRIDAYQIDGLQVKHLSFLKTEYYAFKLNQVFLNSVFINPTTNNITYNTVLSHLDKYDYKSQINSFDLNYLQKEKMDQTWQNWVKVLKLKIPQVWSYQGKLIVKDNPASAQVSLASVTLANFINTWTRFTVWGYGNLIEGDINPMDKIVDKTSFMQLESDFREFGETIGFLDTRNKSAAPATLVEANLFTFDGDGSTQRLTYVEIFEQLNLMMSASRTGELIYEDIIANHSECYINKLDIFNKYYVRESCFRELFAQNYARYFAAMPGAVSFANSLKEQNKFNEVYDTLVYVAKTKNSDPEYIEFSEMRTMAALVTYVENLYLVYDVNHDNYLDNSELKAAFPRFKNFILSLPMFQNFLKQHSTFSWLSKNDQEAVLYRGFLLMVYLGKSPDQLDVDSIDSALPEILPKSTNRYSYYAAKAVIMAMKDYEKIKDLSREAKERLKKVFRRSSKNQAIEPQTMTMSDMQKLTAQGVDRTNIFKVIRMLKVAP